MLRDLRKSGMFDSLVFVSAPVSYIGIEHLNHNSEDASLELPSRLGKEEKIHLPTSLSHYAIKY